MMLSVRLWQNLLMLMMLFIVFEPFFQKPADAHDVVRPFAARPADAHDAVNRF